MSFFRTDRDAIGLRSVTRVHEVFLPQSELACIELGATFSQQSVVFSLKNSVALAGGFSESSGVKNCNRRSVQSHDPTFFQCGQLLADPCSPDGQQGRNSFMR